MERQVAFTDANVLYAAAPRDLLIELAIAKAITLRWTDMVHDEWTAALARSRPDLDPQRIQRTRHLLKQAVPDAVVTGYEPLIPTLALPDPNDRHVLAAAIQGGCQIVLTFNEVHFPDAALEPHGLVAMHPDKFLLLLCTADTGPVVAAAARIRARLSNPPMPACDYITNLARRDLPMTADFRPLEDRL